MKRILVIALIAIILSTLVEFPFYDGHGNFAWSNILGFFAVFGFAGCIVIILISKWLGHYWLQRKEDYYDRNNSSE